MALPKLTSAARAKIELAKLDASEWVVLMLRETGEDQENPQIFQSELAIVYGRYSLDVFLAWMDELASAGFNLQLYLNEVAQTVVAQTIPIWAGSGGKPEFKDAFVEVAFKTIKTSSWFRKWLESEATSETTGDDEDRRAEEDSGKPTIGDAEELLRSMQEEKTAKDQADKILKTKAGWESSQRKAREVLDRFSRDFRGAQDEMRASVLLTCFYDLAQVYLELVDDKESAIAVCDLIPISVRITQFNFHGTLPQLITTMKAEARQFEAELLVRAEAWREEAHRRAAALDPQDESGFDFSSHRGRTSALQNYTQHWKCSEAALARTAVVHSSDLSRWKRANLPPKSLKKTRIEKALRNNEAPTKSTRPDRNY